MSLPSQVNTPDYHLWAKPDGAVANLLSATIRDLAIRTGSPVFEPHLTVLGSLPGTEAEVIRRTQLFAAALDPCEVIFTEVASSAAFYQCLYVRVLETKEIMAMRALACAKFHLASAPYMPHVSLLYGNFPQALKRELIKALPRFEEFSFQVTALHLIRADSGAPSAWHDIAACTI